jgi:hypothetical protein
LQAIGYVLENQNFNVDIQLIKVDGSHPTPVTDVRAHGVAKNIQ